jgi:Regulator of polyketide synthase expression
MMYYTVQMTGREEAPMQMHSIAKTLKAKYLSTGNFSADILSLQLSDIPLEMPDPQQLHILRLSSLLNTSAPEKINLACISDIPYETEALKFPDCNIILLPQSWNELEAFNKIQDLLDEDLCFMVNYIRLKEAIIGGQSPQQFVDLCSEILGNTVIVSGKDTKLITRSHLNDVKSILWDEHGKYGFFSESTVESNQYRAMQKKLYNSPSPVILRKMISDYTTITGKIEIDNFQVGYFSVMDTEKPVTKSDKRMVAAICDLLTYYFKNNYSHENEETLERNKKIQYLLKGGKDSRRFDFYTEIACLHLDAGYRIMIVKHKSRRESLAVLLSWTMKLMPGRAIAEYGENVVAILDNDYHDEEARLDRFASEHDLYIGISEQATTADKFRECYDRALKAVELGLLLGEKKRRFYYSDYAVFHLWQMLSEYSDLSQYCHPAVPRLLEYDRSHRTDFSKTLQVFLRHNGNMSSTAETLSIHRASLLYRIEKLQELLDIDLNDVKTRNYLYASFQMMWILKYKH